MTQDGNQRKSGAGLRGQQQQQGSGGKQGAGQQGMGRQQGSQHGASGQQQAFTTQQERSPQGTAVNQQMGGRQAGGMAGQSQKFAQQIRPHMEVVDNRGQHVGTVDSCEGDRIKLTKSDSSSGQHRYLQLSQVEAVEGGQIRLSGGTQFPS